jgi:uncharacterized protein (DUF2267 family)
MSSTKVSSLDRSIQSSIEWLNDIKEELKWKDDERVYAATKVTLQTLRDRMIVDETFELAAQMPLLLKGIYFDGYDPSGKPLTIRSREELFDEIQDRFDKAEGLSGEIITRAVLKVLYKRAGEGEMDDIKENMPADIQGLFIAAKKSSKSS